MGTIITLTKSSLKMFVRNRQALFFTLVTPLIIMSIFGLIGFDRAPKINIGIVTEEPNSPTREFIEQLKSVPAFTAHTGSRDEEARALADGDRAVVFAVPGNFLPDSQGQAQRQTLTAITNAGEQQNAQTALSIVNQMLDRTTIAMSGTPTLFQVDVREVNSNNLTYIDFLLPGIVALAVMQMSVFSVAFLFADYKEKGILKRILATPLKPFQFIAANVSTRLLISVIQAAILIAVGVFLFKATVIGSFILIAITVLLGATMFLALGFTISGFANTVESVPAIANLAVFPMIFLGGTFFPLETMPNWLQNIAQFLPLTYFSTALRDVMTRDASFSDIQHNLLWMLIWSAVLIVAANFSFNFGDRKS